MSMKRPLSKDLIVFPSDCSEKLSANFTTKEFCDSAAKHSMVSMDLITKLQKMRELLGKPILVNSGYRSPETQQRLRDQGYQTASSISTHQVGCAADIRSPGVNTDELEKVARQAGFESVGVAKTFIHVDTRPGYRRWSY